MRLLRLFLIMAAFLAVLAAVPPACAQESATIQALATVLPALTIIGIHDLQFATVLPGVNKSVNKATLGSAGEFHIQGNNNAEITLDFTLPTELNHETQAVTMIILFNATDASYDDESGGGQSLPAGIIDPRGIATLDLGPTGQMDVWIGGTVQPGLTQTGGDYAADIVLTVAYTGN